MLPRQNLLKSLGFILLFGLMSTFYPIRNASERLNLKEVSADANEAPNVSAQALISAGYANTCAVTTSGGLKCWGFNQSPNRIVTSTATDSITTPTDRSGLTSGVASVSVFAGIGMCAVTSA